MKYKSKGKRILAAIAFGSLFVLGIGYMVMLLWNVLLPEIFDIPEISFIQAIGLLVLSRILFGGFGGHRKFRGHRGWHDKWMRMNPEERAEFKRKWKEHCGEKKTEDIE